MAENLNVSTICPIHRVRYKGSVCPYCQKDRLDRIAKMYSEEIEEYESNKPPTREEFERLVEKFNVKE